MLHTLFLLIVVFFLSFCSGFDERKGCVTGNCLEGSGTFIDPEDGKYIGEFKDGTFNGRGSFSSPEGEKYTGNFKNGAFDGEGTLILSEGDKYVGSFVNGLFEGDGVLSFANGDKYDGISNKASFMEKVLYLLNQVKNTRVGLEKVNLMEMVIFISKVAPNI